MRKRLWYVRRIMILRSNRLNYKVCEVLYSAGVARELTEQSACLAVIARGLTHQVWYEFLTRHFIEEHPTEQIYDDLCKELGVTLTCNAWRRFESCIPHSSSLTVRRA
ncbi:hypothetical protein D3C76_1508150 [compost metagenome]